MPTRFALIGLVAIAPLACKKADTGAAANPNTPAPAAAGTAVDTTTMTRTASGLMYRDIVVGTGAEAVAGKQVGVHYVGRLMNGTQFDASDPGGAPLAFQLGARAVVDGFDEGVTGMRVGGKRLVVIPPFLGYGSMGSGPVPPHAIMVFTLDLVSVN